ncbi:MAG: hypothetical protein CMH49_09315 [Myxococcales bacterium]|nr:hypothetical protein [Myxococcales bacterium]
MFEIKKLELNYALNPLYRRLIMRSMLGLFLVACGAKAPSSINAKQAKLGPSSILEQSEFDTAQSIIADALSLEIESHTKSRGIYDKQVLKLINLGRNQLKKKQFNKALENFKTAYKLAPDEDALLLLAVTQQLRYKQVMEAQSQTKLQSNCQHALGAWQRYLSHCIRCIDLPRYRDRAIINANHLGAQCGAWTLWESEPSRAKLSIDGVRVGRTPLEMWVASGEHQYEMKRANLSEKGSIVLERGQQKQLRPKLVQNTQAQEFTISAKLKCMRSQANKKEYETCSRSMQTNDLFTLEISSNQEVYLYIFAESDQKLSKIYPRQQTGILRADQSVIFPQQNAWQLDDQSIEDQLWLLASATQVPELSKNNAENNQWGMYLKSFAQQNKKPTMDQQKSRSQQGKLFMRWILREPKLAVSLSR